MVEKMPMPVMNERMQPRVKFRFPSARRSTTGRGKVRLRTTNRKPATTAIIAQSRMVASSNQFQREPSSSTYSRVPSVIAKRMMPG